MTWILIKKQMMEIFRSYFYDSKKNKKRSTVSTILFMLIYAVMMVGVLGGMFAYFSKGICGPFAALALFSYNEYGCCITRFIWQCF